MQLLHLVLPVLACLAVPRLPCARHGAFAGALIFAPAFVPALVALVLAVAASVGVLPALAVARHVLVVHHVEFAPAEGYSARVVAAYFPPQGQHHPVLLADVCFVLAVGCGWGSG